MTYLFIIRFVGLQSLSSVQLFATPWTAACQTSLSFTVSQSLLKLMSVGSVMPSNHLILCCPLLLLPSISQHQGLFHVTLWTVAHQASLFMEFSRQGYGSGLPCTPPGDPPDPGSPAL